MDPRLKRMQAVQASLGDATGEYAGWGLLQPVMENLARYRGLAASRSEMEGVLADASARAHAALDLLHESGDAVEGLLSLPEALEAVRASLDDPSSLDLAWLEEVGRASERANLGPRLEAARGRLDYDALCRRVEADPPAPEEIEAALASVLDTLRRLDAGEIGPEWAAAELQAERDLAAQALKQYEEDTYLAPEEWTAEVALADEMLTAGLAGRVQALEGLAAHAQGEEREEWLAALRQAQAALLVVDRLAHGTL